MNQNANILWIGGPGTGKSETIKKMWGIKPQKIETMEFSEEIPGRGVMQLSITEMPSVVYSLKNYAPVKTWFNESTLRLLREADAIVFVLTAKSYGYEHEFQFLVELTKQMPKDKNLPIIIAVSKLEQLRCTVSNSYKDVISSVLGLERYISRLVIKYELQDKVSLNNIVPFSASKDINLMMLRENIWNSVISHTNDIVFDPTSPTIVVSGKRGCGKSSTLNALFGFDLPVDKSVACTKYPRLMTATLKFKGNSLKINVVDLPGIAESMRADMDYYPFYKKYIELADVLLCMNQANVRAYTQDEQFYIHLEKSGSLKPRTEIIIAMNHCDSLFKDEQNMDGVDLQTITLDNCILKDKISDMFERNYKRYFHETHPNLSRDCVVPISASNSWNIELLKDIIISKILKYG